VVEGRPDSGRPSASPSGSDRASERSEVYTVQEAAKVLGITDRRVRALAQEGRIEGQRTDAGWKLFRYSVHSFRDDRRDRKRPLEAQGRSDSLSVPEWLSRVEALQRELGRLEGRLELTERAESTLREERERLLRELEAERQQHLDDVQRERTERVEAHERVERLAQEHARLQEEHGRVEDEAERLREALEAERSKGFWRRLFGG
jgi:excisionase family DNA binding protein